MVFTCFESVQAQVRVQHTAPHVVEKGENQTFTFEFEGEGAGLITEAVLYTRQNIESNYTRHEATVLNQQVSFTLLANSGRGDELAYYVAGISTSGEEIFYPDVPSGEEPLRLPLANSAGERVPVADFVDVSLLTPEEGKVISREDFMFAAALFYEEEDVGDGFFIIELNGRDVTPSAEITPFLIKYIPDDPLFRGDQQIRIFLEKQGEKLLAAEYSFKAAGNISPEVRGEPVFTAATNPGPIPQGSIELSARNQEIAGYNNDALDARLKFAGQYEKLRYSFSGFLTSLETSRLQPQNRFSGQLQYGDWLRAEAGDVFPHLSELSASGRKVRGLSTDLRFFNEKLQFQFLYGQMRRSISNLYNSVQFSEQYLHDEVVDTVYTIGFRDGGRGAFSQNITGGRIALGSREKFQFSLFGLKALDDTSSVHRVRNFQDVMSINPELANELRPSDLQTLQQNPDRLQVNGSGLTPQANTVLGSELSMLFDSQRIQLHTETAVSLFNRDITGGPLTQQRADELGIDLDSGTESLLSDLSWLIIINENMRNLPFRYSENETGDSEITPFFPASILANRSSLHLNYAGHSLQVQYQWIGPDYQSLANRTLLRDVAGFNVSDRFRLFSNRLYILLGYENLRDNLVNTRDATQKTETARSSVSWFPINEYLPNVTLTFRHRTRSNGVARFNPYLDEQYLNSSVRNFTFTDGEIAVGPTPKDNRTLTISSTISQNFNLFGVSHQANASFSHVNTADNAFDYGDSKNNSFSLQLVSRFDGKPFRTRAGWNTSLIESVGGLNNMEINTLSAGGDLFLFQNKLALNTDFSVALNEYENIPLVIDDNNTEIFFDNRFVAASETETRSTNAFSVRAGATYDILAQHTLAAYVNYTSLQNRLAGAGVYPDDRILQLRYIFRF